MKRMRVIQLAVLSVLLLSAVARSATSLYDSVFSPDGSMMTVGFAATATATATPTPIGPTSTPSPTPTPMPTMLVTTPTPPVATATGGSTPTASPTPVGIYMRAYEDVFNGDGIHSTTGAVPASAEAGDVLLAYATEGGSLVPSWSSSSTGWSYLGGTVAQFGNAYQPLQVWVATAPNGPLAINDDGQSTEIITFAYAHAHSVDTVGFNKCSTCAQLGLTAPLTSSGPNEKLLQLWAIYNTLDVVSISGSGLNGIIPFTDNNPAYIVFGDATVGAGPTTNYLINTVGGVAYEDVAVILLK